MVAGRRRRTSDVLESLIHCQFVEFDVAPLARWSLPFLPFFVFSACRDPALVSLPYSQTCFRDHFVRVLSITLTAPAAAAAAVVVLARLKSVRESMDRLTAGHDDRESTRTGGVVNAFQAA